MNGNVKHLIDVMQRKFNSKFLQNILKVKYNYYGTFPRTALLMEISYHNS